MADSTNICLLFLLKRHLCQDICLVKYPYFTWGSGSNLSEALFLFINNYTKVILLKTSSGMTQTQRIGINTRTLMAKEAKSMLTSWSQTSTQVRKKKFFHDFEKVRPLTPKSNHSGIFGQRRPQSGIPQPSPPTRWTGFENRSSYSSKTTASGYPPTPTHIDFCTQLRILTKTKNLHWKPSFFFE